MLNSRVEALLKALTDDDLKQIWHDAAHEELGEPSDRLVWDNEESPVRFRIALRAALAGPLPEPASEMAAFGAGAPPLSTEPPPYQRCPCCAGSGKVRPATPEDGMVDV